MNKANEGKQDSSVSYPSLRNQLQELLDRLFSAGVMAGAQIPEKTGLRMVIAGDILIPQVLDSIISTIKAEVEKKNIPDTRYSALRLNDFSLAYNQAISDILKLLGGE